MPPNDKYVLSLPAWDLNTTLAALLPSAVISAAGVGAQQQTNRTPLVLSTAGQTDGRTPDVT